MRIYVVVSDFGMAGAEIEAVYSKPPAKKFLDKWNEKNMRYTGFSGTWVVEKELDGPVGEDE